MDINIKRFVNIDIKYHVPSSVSSIRDTVVLLTSEGTTDSNKVFSSLAEFKNDETYSTFTTTSKYAEIFFNNGGIKLDIHCGIANSNAIISEIEKLPTTEIIVAYTGDFSEMKTAAEAYTAKEGSTDNISSVYGINQKILLSRTAEASDCKAINNFAVKVGSIVGSEMTIAAYLSRLNIYGTNTIQDYTFTVSNFSDEDLKKIVNDDAVLGNVLDNNMNVDMTLANAVRNLGGNLTNGLDLVNQYVLIVLQQTVTDRLLNLLTQKIKGESGISSIYTTIAAELSKYITNGYLSTSKVWTDDTKTISYNGKTYTLIEKGTPLLLGYHITILPFNSLDNADASKHKCPPIYIFLADSYGIRNITINGEVI